MHPLQARFLDIDEVIAALEGRAQDEDAKALVAAISAEGQLGKNLLKHRGSVPSDLQQRVIIASTKAATARVLADSALGPKAQAALDGVKAAGASDDEALGLVQQAVLEEGFGWAEDPEAFDLTFLLETFASLPALARVDADAVEAWVDQFVKSAPATERPLRLAVAEALLEASWAEGPQPIGAEHVDEAFDLLFRSVARSELERAGEVFAAFLGFLHEKGLVGSTRLARLTDVARACARAPAIDEDELDEEE